MKNYQIKGEDGKMYWISRSVAVLAIVLGDLDTVPKVLVNKRGIGVPNEQGKWNIVCGYLDFDETVYEAAAREVEEECGLKIAQQDFGLMSVLHPITNNPNQNVVISVVAWLSSCPAISIGTKSEKDEVEEVMWMELNVEEIEKKEWAFEHDKILRIFAEEIQVNPFQE